MGSDRQTGIEPDDAITTDLIDLLDVPLADLDTSRDTVLAHAIARLVDELGSPSDAIAGFSSAI